MMKFKYIILMSFVILSISNLKAIDIAGHIDTDANKTKYKANTIVYIEKAEGEFKPTGIKTEVNQTKLTFVPHVLPILVGTTVDFLNNDDVLHNVFSPDACTGKFNLGSWKKGEIRSKKYDQIGCNSVVLCNVHPEMEGYIVVLQNPYFTVTDINGNFIIKNVPEGKYILKVWNEKLKSPDQEVNVSSNSKTDIVFKLTK